MESEFLLQENLGLNNFDSSGWSKGWSYKTSQHILRTSFLRPKNLLNKKSQVHIDLAKRYKLTKMTSIMLVGTSQILDHYRFILVLL